ncbi:hypothetical protein GY45DRAFT_1374555 [Cubamyces sp. BRFM 1775]|nr:hypothetical protein GY45DRAFT_1374555 [Cubamyces sp. BRFM 1775]
MSTSAAAAAAAAAVDRTQDEDNHNAPSSSPAPDPIAQEEPSTPSTPPPEPLSVVDSDSFEFAASLPTMSPVIPTTPAPPASPASSTTSSVSSVLSLTPSTPPSMLRRLNVHRRGAAPEPADSGTVEPADSGAVEPDDDFEGLVSSFAGWRLQSRPATPAPFSGVRHAVADSANFTRTVSAVKRQQSDLKKLVETLETELSQVHNKVSESLDTSTNLLLRTQEMISSERKNMEKRHESTAYNIGSLETKLNKAQRNIATLQAQHIADKGLIEKLANEIAALWDRQEEIGCRLQRAEDTEQHVRQLAEKLRELLYEVRERESEVRRGLSSVMPSLAEELDSAQPSVRSNAVTTASHKMCELLWDIIAKVFRVQAGVWHLASQSLLAGVICSSRAVVSGLQTGNVVITVIAAAAAKPFKSPAAVMIAARTFHFMKHLLVPFVIAMLIYAASSLMSGRAAQSRGDSPIWDSL